MTRRKGERPFERVQQPYDTEHPVARSIGSGTTWFAAWMHQEATSYPELVKRTRLPIERIMALDRDAPPTEAEIATLALAWHTTPDVLMQSLADAENK